MGGDSSSVSGSLTNVQEIYSTQEGEHLQH